MREEGKMLSQASLGTYPWLESGIMKWQTLMVGVALLLAATSRTQAGPVSLFQVRFSTDGGATFGAAISDNGAGDVNSAPGIITANGPSGLVATVTRFTSSNLSFLNLRMQGIIPAGNHNLVTQATLTGIMMSPANMSLKTDATGSNLPGGQAGTAQTWIDNADNAFGTSGGGIAANTGSLIIPSSFNGPFTGSGSISATAQLTAQFSSPSVNSLDIGNNTQIQAAPIPEPASIVVFGMATCSAVAIAWRRKKLGSGEKV